MKKRDKQKQDKLQKATTKRAVYEKTRKLKLKMKARKAASKPKDAGNKDV